jgi:hypothetical protein
MTRWQVNYELADGTRVTKFILAEDSRAANDIALSLVDDWVFSHSFNPDA